MGRGARQCNGVLAPPPGNRLRATKSSGGAQLPPVIAARFSGGIYNESRVRRVVLCGELAEGRAVVAESARNLFRLGPSAIH